MRGAMNYNSFKNGHEGEQKARLLLKRLGYEIFQADWIGFKENKYVMFEIKHKERYKSPPFEGHGLPSYQARKRLEFSQKTGIRNMLIVFEKTTNLIFYQWLDILEQGEFYDTRNSIRVYPLQNFKTLRL